MQLNLDSRQDLTFVIGNSETVAKMPSLAPFPPFSEEIIDFLDTLSKRLIREGAGFSDVVAFGLWCRKSAIIREKNKYDDINQRLGKGIVFHSTPSNVPVNFAFSFTTGLLAGNANIVRLPAKDFPQVFIICGVINDLLQNQFVGLAPYVCMVKYASTQYLHTAFSGLSNARVIWGGDETIARLRRYQTKPRGNDINFADRYSIAVIDADLYLESENKSRIVHDFFNDTYLFDQNACTTPGIIFWRGKNIDQGKDDFWNKLHDLVLDKYNLSPAQSYGKTNAFFRVASQFNVKLVSSSDQLITRVKLMSLENNIMDYKYHSGFFFEYDISDLDQIAPVCSDKCQTLTYYGLEPEEIRSFITRNRPQGLDRAVPVGKSMEFSLTWDGFDLIRQLSRKITIL